MDNPQRDKQCPVCGKRYLAVGPAQKHIRRRHPQCTEPPVILPQSAFKMPGFQVPVEAPKRTCNLCPHLPVFESRSARRKHVEAVHTTKCPICSALLPKQPLATHLQRVHGIINGVGPATNQTAPQFTGNSAPVEPPRATPLYQTSGKAEGPSPQTIAQGNSRSVASAIHDLPLERFYCQDYDCGRGFSSKAHLELHVRFFHTPKPKQTTERVKEATTLPNHIPDADGKSPEHSPAYFSPASTTSFPNAEEPVIQGGSGPVEDSVPVPPRERDQSVELEAENGEQQTNESLLGPPATTQSGIQVTPRVTASTPLSLQCRMCDAPPTVGARPTVTTCGHLFCSGCITQHVMSTSRCPVCDNALLLYCLFKLDLLVLS